VSVHRRCRHRYQLPATRNPARKLLLPRAVFATRTSCLAWIIFLRRIQKASTSYQNGNIASINYFSTFL